MDKKSPLIVVCGPTASGKTALAEIIRDHFYRHKIIEKAKLTMVDAVDYSRFVDKWDDNIKKAMQILGEDEYDELHVRLVRLKFHSDLGN